MTERELKKLRRADLLELLLAQCKENEALRTELEKTNAQLASRAVAIDNAGSIAEASLQLSGVFEAAQAACVQYIENIQMLSKRQEELCAKMEEETKVKCDEMVRKAKAEADAYWMEISTKTEEVASFYAQMCNRFALQSDEQKAL